tara:strand:- start:110 stop:310 length:201 start_codon:yes stop_codon:yes gene_type:complete
VFELIAMRSASAALATITFATATVVSESSLIPLGLVIIACGITWKAASKLTDLEARVKALENKSNG